MEFPQVAPLTCAISPEIERKRLQALYALDLLDTQKEELFDEITRMAASLTNAHTALITLIDENRVWFKSKVGGTQNAVPRCDSFCQYTIAGNSLLEIVDTTLDPLFRDSAVVKGDPHWRYYAGVPLEIADGLNIGTLCILDTKPFKLSELQIETLVFLSRTVIHLIKMRKSFRELESSKHLLKVLQEINEDFIRSPKGKRELFKKMLDYVLSVTGSEYGFIGEVFIQDEKQALRTLAITDISWNDETRALYKKYEEKGMLFTNHNTLFGYTLKTGESVITNEPGSDPRRGGIPHGHPPLNCYMGLAIKDSKDNLIGMMGLANRKAGYGDSDQAFLQPFLSTCGTMIIALQTLNQRELVEEENKRISTKLLKAQSIAKLGNWEYDVKTNTVQWSDELYHIYELAVEGPFLNYKAYHSRLHPEDAERNDAIAARAISEKRDFTFEGRLIFDDGRAKVVSINGYPSFDENGDLVSIQGTTQDITDRKRREEEVQRFFNLAVDLFCIVSKEGFILRNSMSFKSALGYSDFELTDMPFIDFVHPTDRDKTQHEIDFILRGGTSRNFENRLLTKTGEYITLSWTSTYDVESQRIYSAAKDITENKLLERNLLESQIELEKSKAKDVFLANMSHEIRTPLNAIMGFNDILSQTALTQDQRRNVNLISNASKTLNVLINDILDISKLENGKLDLEHAPFRVESVAKQVVQMHVSKARTKGVKLLLSYDHEIPDVVIGDETRLLQILLNLVSNAIKFTEEGSVEIRISESQLKDNQVTIDFEVKDTGIGIKSDKLAVIFERFTQAESYTTRMYGGTGLGLNIVRSLVELHNGKLDVKSEFGKGSIFSFSLTFPVASQQQTFLLDSPSLKVEVDGLSDMSVLVVEDNEHNQILADTYLQKHHALVDIAVNGKLAIDMVLKKKYDVILMDIQMPIMDGFTTTNILRTELKIDVPIIGCSAHAMVSERKKCIEVGMNDYISKPYTEDVLIGALAKFKKKPSAKALDEHDDFAAVIAALERNISKTYADKIVHIFKERLPNEVVLLEQSIEERDFELMEERAHYQSGSMSSLHFKKGYQLAYAAERAATEQNADKAAEATNRLIVYLKELMSYLNSVVN